MCLQIARARSTPVLVLYLQLLRSSQAADTLPCAGCTADIIIIIILSVNFRTLTGGEHSPHLSTLSPKDVHTLI